MSRVKKTIYTLVVILVILAIFSFVSTNVLFK